MMTPETISIWQVIGSRVTTPTISWDEEFKLIDGALYDIDVHQDFSAISLNGEPMTDMPVDSIIELINNFESINESIIERKVVPSAEEYRREREFWEWLERNEKKERNWRIKWEKGKKKRMKRHEQLLDDIDSGLYFVKW